MLQDKSQINFEKIRDEFDSSFSMPVTIEESERVNYLLIKLQDDTFAVKTRDLKRIISAKPIITLPKQAPSMLGISGIEGQGIPIFSLEHLMSYSKLSKIQWFALCGHQVNTIGFGFSKIVANIWVNSEQIMKSHSSNQTFGTLNLLRTHDQKILIIDFPSIFEYIYKKFQQQNSKA